MKKLWDKFRRWLIRKLGGFYEIPQPVEVKLEELTIAPITACVMIHQFEADGLSDNEFEQMVRRRLAKGIAHELVFNKTCRVMQSYNPRRQIFNFTGIVYAVMNGAKEREENGMDKR